MSTADTQIGTEGSALSWTDGLDRLREQVDGPVLLGSHAVAAAEAGTFNLAITHSPAVVVGATSAEDVAAAVRWAVDHGLGVAAQATGHGPVAAVEDAMIITTRRMDGVTIDPDRRTATYEAGVRWSQVVEAATPYGLAPLCGSSQGVGAVGYTMGGGLGMLARKYGFAADLVQSFEIVTADGVIRYVDAETEPDLFWAVRGGKSNFGIVTSVTTELAPVGGFYGGAVFFAASSASDVLHAYRSWAPTLPDEATSSIAMLRVPPIPELPEPIRGKFVVHLRYAHSGDAAEAAALLAPMLESGEVVLSGVGALAMTQSDLVHQDPTDPIPVWEHGGLLRELTPEVVDTLVSVAGPDVDVPLIFVELRQLGGAVGRGPVVPNAVSGRDAAYAVFALGIMAAGLEAIVPGVCAGVIDAVQPWSTGRSLMNFAGAAALTPETVGALWEPDVHARLLEVKDEVDPSNVFRFGFALR
jgi:FAD binding domain